MARIRLDLSYAGTNYCGWQIQPNAITVQEVIQSKIAKVLGYDVKLIGSGRTDAGVHAIHQVAHFDCEPTSFEATKWVEILNSLLPKDIRIITAKEVESNFHARFSASQRGYCYWILPKVRENELSTFYHPYCWATHKAHDVNLLNEYASQVVGEHDFTSFCAAGDGAKSKVRNVFSAFFVQEEDFIKFYISANGFLWNMVRSIVGTFINLESQDATTEDLKKIIEAKDRSLGGATAPAKGLFLNYVLYEKKESQFER